jgi:hypothetical protein
MRLILPRPFGQKAALFAVLLVFACQHPQAPVKPGEPIPAEPDATVDTADKECDGLVAAVTAYGDCPNATDDERAWAKQVVEVAQQSFDAGKKGNPDAEAQKVIAHACHRAAESVKNATLRCQAGKAPPPNY